MYNPRYHETGTLVDLVYMTFMTMVSIGVHIGRGDLVSDFKNLLNWNWTKSDNTFLILRVCSLSSVDKRTTRFGVKVWEKVLEKRIVNLPRYSYTCKAPTVPIYLKTKYMYIINELALAVSNQTVGHCTREE